MSCAGEELNGVTPELLGHKAKHGRFVSLLFCFLPSVIQIMALIPPGMGQWKELCIHDTNKQVKQEEGRAAAKRVPWVKTTTDLHCIPR